MNHSVSNQWSIQQSADLYRIEQWGEGYFKINAQGHVQMGLPHDAASVDLSELTRQIQQIGLSLPVLVRFEDILQDRVKRLCDAFTQAFERCAECAQARYTAVYPIKVNQQQSVVEQVIKGQQQFGQAVGLEAGSKPELMIILGMAPPNSLIVCNGYKDREFIRLALISQYLGHQTIIVIEKLSELILVLEESEKLSIKPKLGLRVRLASLGKGQWQNTGGEGAKFGLSAAQVWQLVALLKQHDALACLQLLHFHMGSQIADLRDIQRGMQEASRYFVELHALGARLTYADVGGGLGIDYEGTRSENTYSINYDLQAYADVIVGTLAEYCQSAGIDIPHVITETGRYITAHHAVLISNVVDQESYPVDSSVMPLAEDAPEVLRALFACEQADAVKRQMQTVIQAFSDGELNLQQRMTAEQFARQRLAQLAAFAKPYADKYFVNFSLFQSLPDIWGIGQLFPIMPVQHLHRQPDRQVVLQDLTCDSDGTIHEYVCHQSSSDTLPLHAVSSDEPYLLAFFLVGAYQEILGDLHNLFGDTDSINVKLNRDNMLVTTSGFTLKRPEHGDTVDELLRTIHYDPKQLLAHCKQKLIHYFDQNQLPDKERRLQFYREIEAGFIGYTYLEE